MTQQPREILLDDQLERRIRRPVDAMACLLTCLAIVVVSVAAVEASATTSGVEHDLVHASRQLPRALLVVAPPIALFALLVLPVALAVSQLFRRQARRLVEAVATGAAAGVIAAVVNAVLQNSHASRLYYAIIMARPSDNRVNVLDPYLVALIAYVTIIGLTGRTAWRNALVLAVGVYAVVQLAAAHTTVLTVLLTLLAGRAIGLAVRYGAGSASPRPTARDIALALSATDGLSVTAIRRVPHPRVRMAASRHYSVTAEGGRVLDVVVYDRDQQAAGAFYRLYRWLRVQGEVSRRSPLSIEHMAERRALMSYAARDAGAPTPQLRPLVRVGPDAIALAYEHCAGTPISEREPACTDAELSRVWDAAGQLHARHVTHRGLTANRILLTADGQVVLLDPGDGDVAASDLQIRLDQAQLIVELALLVGPRRSARMAIEKIGARDLVAVLPLLQTVALARPTRRAVRRRRDVLPAVRKELLAAVPGEQVTPVQLERIRARTLVTLVASIAASYLLVGELAQASLSSLLRSADWRWALVGLALSATTYGGATLSLAGFVSERLDFGRTFLVQVASSFVALVTPAAVGGAALNVRYLQRRNIPLPVAAASVSVSQVVAFVLHILLLIVFGALTGTGRSSPIKAPTWAYFVVVGLVALSAVMLSLPAGRRLVRARLAPAFGQVLPRLLEVAQQPRKLAEGIGGALLLSLSYILCLAACVAAFGGSVSVEKIGFVYLTGAALGSIMPTPGGLGAVEAALTAGLTTAGVPGAVAVSAVLLYRLLTFWLPVPAGWVSLHFLERHHDL